MTIEKRHVIAIVGIIVLAATLIAFGRHVDWPAVAAALKGTDGRLVAAAIVVNIISLAIHGTRWWVFLRPLGASLSLALRATTAGAALNTLLVAQGGEGARVLIVSRASGASTARVLASVAMERVLDLLSYLVLLVSAAWIIDLPADVERLRIPATVLLGLLVIGLLLLGGRERGLAINPRLLNPQRGIPAYIRKTASAMSELSSFERLRAAIPLSLAVGLTQAMTYHLTAMAAHLPISFAGSLAAFLACTVSFLVRATPGNVGLFQIVYVLAVRPFGVAEEPAIAVALLIQTLQVIPVLIIAAFIAPGLGRKGVLRAT